MIVSAQEATRTRLCAAERCEQDAETNSRLCWRCAKKDSVRLHVEPPRLSDTLRCCTCKLDLPDDAFSRKADAPHRRFRHHECKECCRERRVQARKTLGVSQRETEQKRVYAANKRELLRQLREDLS